ncbi:MAG: LysM peptidoglycan-binding domain-containing protein [Victivallales bacterium]|nr:LysM peptidoglycan-binding domain-containing protein [Victivallales bacterium]
MYAKDRKSFSASFCLLTVAASLLASACMQRPLLLRNRPNVPPPTLDPYGDEVFPVAATSPASLPGEMPALPPVSAETPALPPPSELAALPDFTHTPLTHTVQQGDSFWKISRDYGVAREELASCNNLPLDKPLRIGTVLVIPPGGIAGYQPPRNAKPPAPDTTAKPKPATKAKTAEGGTYTVVSGDSLWSIARRHNTTTNELAQANNLDPKRPIMAGMKLIMPGSTPQSGKPAAAKPEKPSPAPEPVDIPEKFEDPDPIDDLLRDAVDAGSTKAPAKADPLEGILADLQGKGKAADPAAAGASQDFFMEEILPNETIQEIAERHGLSVEALLKANPEIKLNQKLKPFTSIKIPLKRY